MTREGNWYGLNMLSLYVEMSDGRLEASFQQLMNLQKVQSRSHVFDVQLLHRIIKSYTSQNADNWVFFEQCKKWREQNPNEEQLAFISQVEKSAYELEQVNFQILKLANALTSKTIDGVLAEKPSVIGLESLTPSY